MRELSPREVAALRTGEIVTITDDETYWRRLCVLNVEAAPDAEWFDHRVVLGDSLTYNVLTYDVSENRGEAVLREHGSDEVLSHFPRLYVRASGLL